MKAGRQRLVTEILRTRRVDSQNALAELLLAQGERVTQATLSRDLLELGAIKVRDSEGSVYRVPDSPADPQNHLRKMLLEFAHEITPTGSLVVVRTPPGGAQPLARALDGTDVAGLLATVAGDDTILCVCKPKTTGSNLAAALRELAAQDEGAHG